MTPTPEGENEDSSGMPEPVPRPPRGEPRGAPEGSIACVVSMP